MITRNDASLCKVAATTPIQDIVAVFREDGGVIIEGFLTEDQVDRINTEAEPLIRQRQPGGTYDSQELNEFWNQHQAPHTLGRPQQDLS